jgi:hypothetical protein
MQHVWQIEDVRTGFWWEDLAERDQLEDLCVDGRIILKRVFKKQNDDFTHVTTYKANVSSVHSGVALPHGFDVNNVHMY